MSNYRRLLELTAAERHELQAIPIIVSACREGVSLEVYLDYLGQAYHHVRHTCPLLAQAAARCGDDDEAYRDALFDYIAEERGHERWILADIAALGGDAEAVRRSRPRMPCHLMVAYARYAIDHVGPYALLGMVHVLEGMSVLLAANAAQAIGRRLAPAAGGAGFSYLSSHGALDVDHVAFFGRLLDGIGDGPDFEAVVATASIMYRLFGDIFRDIGARQAGIANEAA